MDKIKDMVHGGHKKEGEGVQHDTTLPTTTAGGFGQPGLAQPPTEGGHEKKGVFGLGGHHKDDQEGGKKKGGFMGIGGSSSSSSSSDEEREGAKERNRVRREKRAQRKAGAAGGTAGTTTVPLEGGEKKHGFFG